MSLSAVAARYRVPLKFLPRALGVLNYLRYVTVDTRHTMVRFRHGGKRVRQPISRLEYLGLLTADHFRCGHCGRQFPPDELEIDHVVPISLLGADEPGNWVALCAQCNKVKWSNFHRDFIKFYRGKPVYSPVGVRFEGGSFWPRINGKVRRAKRARSTE